MTVYQIEYLDDEGNVTSIIVDEDKELMKDFEQAAMLAGEKYCFEIQRDNPYNENISVQGYYSTGVYLPTGYPIRKHYQNNIKGGKNNWIKKYTWTRE